MIRHFLLVTAWAFFLLFFQGAVLGRFLPDLLIPNLLTMLVVFVTMRHLSHFGLFLAFFLGLMTDLFSARVLGVWSASYVCLFIAIALIAHNIFIESRFVLFVTTFFASLFSESIFLMVSGLVDFFSFFALGKIIFTSFLTALMAVFLVPILSKQLKENRSRVI